VNTEANQQDTTATATPTVSTEANQQDTTATPTVNTEDNQHDTTATATPTVSTEANQQDTTVINDSPVLQPLESLLEIQNSVNYSKDDVEKCIGKRKRILVVSTQIPGRGGSATNAYNILKILKKYNYPVAALFLEAIDRWKLEEYDPEDTGCVFRTNRWSNLTTKRGISFCKREMNSIVKVINKFLGGEPELILCKNYVAPIDAKLLYNNTPIVYLISGSKSLTQSKFSYTDVSKIPYDKYIEKYRYKDEEHACEVSDYIIPNSHISKNIFKYTYDNYSSKIHGVIDTSLLSIVKQDIPAEKDYDIIFCSSSFGRHIKGPELGYKILSSEKLRKYKKLVVGNDNDMFSGLENIVIKPLVPNTEVIRLLLKSKIVIVPSVFEASPNICTEAFSCDCKIVSTLNVGNTEKHNPFYRVHNREDVKEWVDKIIQILTLNEKLPEQYSYNPYYDTVCKFFNLLKEI
jgi:hypothetical protein